MLIRRSYIIVFLLTALDLFVIPMVESVAYYDRFPIEALGWVAAIGMILSIILACIAFRDTPRRSIRIAAFWAAALPFTIGTLWWLLSVKPNMHGLSLPLFMLYGVVSEAAAIIFAITASFKKRA